MESLTQKLQPGVVLNFRKIGGKSSPPNTNTNAAGQEGMDVEGE